jgi:hypothetical protein
MSLNKISTQVFTSHFETVASIIRLLLHSKLFLGSHLLLGWSACIASYLHILTKQRINSTVEVESNFRNGLCVFPAERHTNNGRIIDALI